MRAFPGSSSWVVGAFDPVSPMKGCVGTCVVRTGEMKVGSSDLLCTRPSRGKEGAIQTTETRRRGSSVTVEGEAIGFSYSHMQLQKSSNP